MCKVYVKAVVLSLVIFATFNLVTFGQDVSKLDQDKRVPKADATDVIISSTIKLLAKAYVATLNLEELKKHNIPKIQQKEDVKFKRDMEKLYNEIKDTPIEGLVGLKPSSTKEDAIKRINKVTKEELYKAIDSIPDYLIGQKIKDYFASQGKAVLSSKDELVNNIKSFWNDMIKKAMPSKAERK